MDDKKLSSELWNCPNKFQFQCPREWKMLSRTGDAAVRYCSACAQSVYLCGTPREFVEHGNNGHCVAVPTDRAPNVATRFLMGRIAPSAFEDLENEQSAAQEFWTEVLAQNPKFDRIALTALSEKIKRVQEGHPE